jgi:hypothetical protein
MPQRYIVVNLGGRNAKQRGFGLRNYFTDEYSENVDRPQLTIMDRIIMDKSSAMPA